MCYYYITVGAACTNCSHVQEDENRARLLLDWTHQ